MTTMVAEVAAATVSCHSVS